MSKSLLRPITLDSVSLGAIWLLLCKLVYNMVTGFTKSFPLLRSFQNILWVSMNKNQLYKQKTINYKKVECSYMMKCYKMEYLKMF